MKKLPVKQNDWKTNLTSTVYENAWIEVKHNEVENPGGGEGVYGVVHFKNIAIGVIPIDINGMVTLVGQFRYPQQSYSWEIPAGGGAISESKIEAAKRELSEETGMTSLNWTKVLEMHLSNSVSDEKAVLFLAEDCKFGFSNPEETESIEILRISIEELFLRVQSGEITDSLTVAASLWLKVNEARF